MSTSVENLELHEPSAAVAAVPSALHSYYELTKPRMNFLVVLTTFAGFYMASSGALDWVLLLHTIMGTALTAAGASVLNQYFERDFDALMPRTKTRPLPAGYVPPSHAVALGTVLGTMGVVYLACLVNPLTAAVGFLTLASYVWVYTPLKRRTTLNTVIGAVPGALPPVMGFTAVANALSPESLAMFGILFFWQLPHFLAIAILYRGDYAAGGFLMLPVVDESLDLTSRQILLWGAALVPVSLMPTMLGMTGAFYFGAATLLGLAFFTFGISCAVTKSRTDARKLFFASIVYLPMLLMVMAMDKVV